VESNVPFHLFRHEPVQYSAASRHELQHGGTLMLVAQRTFDGFDLSRNPPDATEEPLFVFGCVAMSFVCQ
jgi:hypothetical protein